MCLHLSMCLHLCLAVSESISFPISISIPIPIPIHIPISIISLSLALSRGSGRGLASRGVTEPAGASSRAAASTVRTCVQSMSSGAPRSGKMLGPFEKWQSDVICPSHLLPEHDNCTVSYSVQFSTRTLA